ncbi:MAG TPA: protein kinase [Blastocatellia bacterium]|nr:protein kinase [Blastocatellia bacterium]
MSITADTRLGRYEIRSKLGEGGMGEVYLAVDTELDRTVAIKILPEALASDQQRLQRFIQEAKAASALNHPHILTIYEIGTIGASRFIATEFIDGETLRDRISAGMKLTDILEFSIQAAGALASAHAAGIIHRDIKPENIMVRRDGYIKLLDFGLAKLTESQASSGDTEALTKAMVNTGAGTVMGTANYMSPEQAKGTTVDARTDLWSLGAVLYEMVTGHSPFAGETPTETISLILQREPAPLTRYAREVPGELERIVTKALTKDREERYQTSKDMLIDFRNLKRRIEVEAEIDRTIPPQFREGTSTSSGQTVQATVSGGVAATVPVGAPATVSSAEYIISGIRAHKAAAIIVAMVLVIGAIGLIRYLHARNTEVAIESIAVLPFANQNNDPGIDWVSDGLTESIINSLTQLPNLKVIARSSVFRYKDKQADPLAAGKELGVRALLTGRLFQRGEEVIVSAELVDLRDNKQLWGDRYERRMADLLSVQREIAREITSNLRPKISGAEQNRASKSATENPEAYQLYLKGRFYWNKRTGESIKKSVEYFSLAIEKDPNYALAYAGIADAYTLIPGYSAGAPQEYFPKAKAVARKALQIDDTLAEAHTSLADVLYSYDRNFAESFSEYQRAIELNPNYPTAHHWYGEDLAVAGRFDEGIAELRRAQELDPLSLIINADLGEVYTWARQYDKAIEQLRKTIEMDQSFYYAHWQLGLAYELKGLLPEALAEYQRARQLDDDPWVLALLGHAYAVSGKRDEALKALDQLKEASKQRYTAAYGFAVLYTGLGERDQAFQWLERSYQDRANDLINLKIDPLLDNLRSDPRFADLVRRVGLSQ